MLGNKLKTPNLSLFLNSPSFLPSEFLSKDKHRNVEFYALTWMIKHPSVTPTKDLSIFHLGSLSEKNKQNIKFRFRNYPLINAHFEFLLELHPSKDKTPILLNYKLISYVDFFISNLSPFFFESVVTNNKQKGIITSDY